MKVMMLSFEDMSVMTPGYEDPMRERDEERESLDRSSLTI